MSFLLLCLNNVIPTEDSLEIPTFLQSPSFTNKNRFEYVSSKDEQKLFSLLLD